MCINTENYQLTLYLLSFGVRVALGIRLLGGWLGEWLTRARVCAYIKLMAGWLTGLNLRECVRTRAGARGGGGGVNLAEKVTNFDMVSNDLHI